MGFNTFSMALSGLSTNTQGLNVVGNNVANINTVGYKMSNITFTDVLGASVAGAGTASGGNVGMGARVGSVAAAFTQGGLETTNRPTDVAIQGSGFFAVSDGTARLYTRAGNFQVDGDGNLMTSTGHFIQGYGKDPVTGIIDTAGGLSNVKIPKTTGNSNPTSNFELTFNLDNAAAVGTGFSTTVQIYDSVGQVHLASVDFVKDAVTATETSWKFDITIPHKKFTGVAQTSTDKFSLITGAIAAASPAAGTLVFDSNGKLKSVYTGATPATLPPVANLKLPPAGVTIPAFSNSATLSASGVNWKLIPDTGDYNATGLAAPSILTFSNQDGVPPGEMNSLTIQADGTIAGIFTNGSTVEVAKIAIAMFSNENGLISRGSGLFAETPASGSSLVGTPGDGGRGQLFGGALELSNVDLATEFTKMITFQRGYQANARMMTLTDQILQETVNLRS